MLEKKVGPHHVLAGASPREEIVNPIYRWLVLCDPPLLGVLFAGALVLAFAGLLPFAGRSRTTCGATRIDCGRLALPLEVTEETVRYCGEPY